MITLGCGVFTAGFSEFLQLYVKGRSGAILDVGIDSLGFLIGMAVTFGICLLVTFLYNKKKKTN